jgi:hypothetical protein
MEANTMTDLRLLFPRDCAPETDATTAFGQMKVRTAMPLGRIDYFCSGVPTNAVAFAASPQATGRKIYEKVAAAFQTELREAATSNVVAVTSSGNTITDQSCGALRLRLGHLYNCKGAGAAENEVVAWWEERPELSYAGVQFVDPDEDARRFAFVLLTGIRREPRVHNAINLVYRSFDDALLVRRNMDAVSISLLTAAQDEKIPIDVLLSMLTATLPWTREFRQERTSVVDVVRRRALKEYGQSDTEAMLRGLT